MYFQKCPDHVAIALIQNIPVQSPRQLPVTASFVDIVTARVLERKQVEERKDEERREETVDCVEYDDNQLGDEDTTVKSFRLDCER